MIIYSDVLVICAAGMFGGLLYGLHQNDGLLLPHRGSNKHIINFGFFSNMLFGVAGAIVIFLIVPGGYDFVIEPGKSSIDYIKSLATALIGGWGGIAVLNKVFGQTVSTLQQQIMQFGVQEKEDAKVLELTDQFLHSSTNVAIADHELYGNIKTASPKTQVAILNSAKQLRSDTWKDDKVKMERTIPVFMALAESELSEDMHRIYGQLGFALKDQRNPQFREAKINLDKAINVRNKNGVGGFAWYEFNRAVCNINLDAAFNNNQTSDAVLQQSISSDLKVALRDQELISRLQKSVAKGGDPDVLLLKKWLDLNNITLASVGLDWFYNI